MLALNGSGATNLNARKNLGAAQAQVAESIHRLSSGVRLHSAADDASGLAISALLLNQSQVVSGAQSNLGAATSMLQLADSSLAQANDALMRVKELVTQGSNDSLGQEQYLSIAQEIIQQLEEVQKLADRTSYNGNRVLGGAGNNLIDVQKTVSTVQNTTSIVGHPQGTWVSVDGSSAVGSLTGTLRVTITASAGTIRLTSSTNGVIIDDPASDAYNGNATSISLEGTRADILTALAKLEGQRTGAGDLNIAVAVNTVSSFTNGDFSNGLSGWEAMNQRVRLGDANGSPGPDKVAGFFTPSDPTTAPGGGKEASATGAGSYGPIALSSGSASLQLAVSGVQLTPTSQPVGSVGSVVHGPVLVSKSAVNIPAGEEVSFDWASEAIPGGDAFDVFGYLLDVDSGRTEIILNRTAVNASETQPFITANHRVQTSGNYKFVFMAGSWDETGGTVTGARLKIDNVSVTTSVPVQTSSGSFRVEAQRTVTTQTTISNTVTEKKEVPVTSNQWEFLSGTNDDRVELQGIAIWGSAETALQRYGNGRVTDPALRTGSLNALYKRMIWITDPTSNAFANGNGFEVFQQALGSSSNGPDEQVFASDGTLTSSRTRSISQLVDAAISQLQGHRSYFGAIASRVEKNISNLGVQQVGLTATSSRFRDTDYGYETARLTKMQILQQAATAMLAQANAMPSIVSALIKFQ